MCAFVKTLAVIFCYIIYYMYVYIGRDVTAYQLIYIYIYIYNRLCIFKNKYINLSEFSLGVNYKVYLHNIYITIYMDNIICISDWTVNY